MKTTTFVIALIACFLLRDTPVAEAGDHAKVLLAFSSMYGVDGPFVGDGNPIRDFSGDDLPWVIDRVEGLLLTDGHLTIAVRGLVFADDESVPPELRGINDEVEFRGAVSCLTEQGERVATANVITKGFRATRSGNAFIHTRVKLPNPCVAPIVFVLSGEEDDWFAVTGVEVETDNSCEP
jgi:hypothetical protein